MEIPKRGESAGGLPIQDPHPGQEQRGWFLGATDLLFEDRRTAVLRDFDREKLHVVFLDSVRRRIAPEGASGETIKVGLAMPGTLKEIEGWAVEVERHDGPPEYFGPFKMIGAAEAFAKRKGGTLCTMIRPPTFDQLSTDLAHSLRTVLEGRDHPVTKLNRRQLTIIRDRAQEALDAS